MSNKQHFIVSPKVEKMIKSGGSKKGDQSIEKPRKFTISFSRTIQLQRYESAKLSLMQEYDRNETTWDKAYDEVKTFVLDKITQHQYAQQVVKR